MRAPAPDGLTARDASRYLEVLADLEASASEQRFAGAGSFYAWERLNALIARLKHQFDAFELEGDGGPVRREVEAFQADLRRMQVRPDPRVLARLDALLDELAPSWTVLTASVPAAAAPPPLRSYRAIARATLEALHRRARAHDPLPPG